jgi:hypothetical protein
VAFLIWWSPLLFYVVTISIEWIRNKILLHLPKTYTHNTVIEEEEEEFMDSCIGDSESRVNAYYLHIWVFPKSTFWMSIKVVFLKWKVSLDHQSQSLLSSWNGDWPCNWVGIRCDTSGIVTNIIKNQSGSKLPRRWFMLSNQIIEMGSRIIFILLWKKN